MVVVRAAVRVANVIVVGVLYLSVLLVVGTGGGSGIGEVLVLEMVMAWYYW